MNLTVRMLLKTESLNYLLRMHHHQRAKLTRMHRDQAWKHMRQHGVPPADFPPITVTITRHSAGELDGDNLQGGVKAVRDGIADWLGVPDNDPRVTWLYAQAPAAPKQYAVVVDVRET